jgi:hypothetical protein
MSADATVWDTVAVSHTLHQRGYGFEAAGFVVVSDSKNTRKLHQKSDKHHQVPLQPHRQWLQHS